MIFLILYHLKIGASYLSGVGHDVGGSFNWTYRSVRTQCEQHTRWPASQKKLDSMKVNETIVLLFGSLLELNGDLKSRIIVTGSVIFRRRRYFVRYIVHTLLLQHPSRRTFFMRWTWVFILIDIWYSKHAYFLSRLELINLFCKMLKVLNT